MTKMYLDSQKRGPKAFVGLVKSLKDSDNFEAAAILDESVEIPSKPKPLKLQNPPASREE